MSLLANNHIDLDTRPVSDLVSSGGVLHAGLTNGVSGRVLV